jgi:hypothetical protein
VKIFTSKPFGDISNDRDRHYMCKIGKREYHFKVYGPDTCHLHIFHRTEHKNKRCNLHFYGTIKECIKYAEQNRSTFIEPVAIQQRESRISYGDPGEYTAERMSNPTAYKWFDKVNRLHEAGVRGVQ